MKALIATPALQGPLTGNLQTARRWAGILTQLHHTVEIAAEYRGQDCDVLIALHALKSAPSMARFHRERPGAPLVVALTGTDLYRDLAQSETARQALHGATSIIALQPLAARELDPHLRSRVRVILQSVEPLTEVPQPARDTFEISVVGHLRPVKDPLRTAEAVRLLPAESRVRVLHVGAALQPEMERLAVEEQASNHRYRWLGACSHDDTLSILARSRLHVLTSKMEGGAHVIGEAVVHNVPVLSSRIPGSVGLLGDDYPGYFPAGDTAALAQLIRRAETDPAWLEDLRTRCARLAPGFDPGRELQAWENLVTELLSDPKP